MAVTLEPLPGETVLASEPVPEASSRASFRPSFRFGYLITNEAVYVPVPKDGLTIREPLQPFRIPLSAIRAVSLSPDPALTPSLIFYLVVLGVWLAVALPRLVSGWHWNSWDGFILVVAGLNTFRLARGASGRWRLKLFAATGSLDATPSSSETTSSLDFTPSPLESPSQQAKLAALAKQQAFVSACSRAGLRVHPAPSA